MLASTSRTIVKRSLRREIAILSCLARGVSGGASFDLLRNFALSMVNVLYFAINLR